MDQISNSDELLGVIFTPFVIAVIRLVIVVLVGIFIATITIAIPLRRISVMQIEIEFVEKATAIAEIQDKQLNQLLFLERVLKDNGYFIGMYFQKEGIPYREVMEDILDAYEKFFNDELKTNLHYEIVDVHNREEFGSRKLNRLQRTLRKPESDDHLIRNHTIMGENLLMFRKEEQEQELLILLSSATYEFTDYDVKIVQSLLETTRIICDSISIVSDDQL